MILLLFFLQTVFFLGKGIDGKICVSEKNADKPQSILQARCEVLGNIVQREDSCVLCESTTWGGLWSSIRQKDETACQRFFWIRYMIGMKRNESICERKVYLSFFFWVGVCQEPAIFHGFLGSWLRYLFLFFEVSFFPAETSATSPTHSKKGVILGPIFPWENYLAIIQLRNVYEEISVASTKTPP